MSTGSAQLNHTQASANEANNKPDLSVALPLRCLPTWDTTMGYYVYHCIFVILRFLA